ncbi:MAG: chemotaxis protein CheW [Planctomycetes bacterium]|nr:chemotaxis protein CheW [Planctomycetota bacterium]
MSTSQYCTFQLDRVVYGVAVHEVQEVIRFQEMTRVPRAHAVVSGLINLRGQIVTAIDLRTRLGLEPRTTEQKPMNVVVRTEDGAVSFLVDQIGDVIEVSEAQFEEPPPTLAAEQRELVRGVYKLEGSLLLVLDTRRLLSLAASLAAA